MKNEKTKELTSRKWGRKEILMVVLVGVLVLTVGIQTVQLAGLAGNQIVVSAGTNAASVKTNVASAPSVPANLQNLPSMVGGC